MQWETVSAIDGIETREALLSTVILLNFLEWSLQRLIFINVSISLLLLLLLSCFSRVRLCETP